jgi:hypothetical protein
MCAKKIDKWTVKIIKATSAYITGTGQRGGEEERRRGGEEERGRGG